MDKVPKSIRFRRIIGVVPMIAVAIPLNVESQKLKGVIFLIGFLIFIIGIGFSSKEK